MEKRGVSPVIATVLLIVITVILGAIVFVWANGFFTEGLTKNGEPVENACDSVSFEIQYISATQVVEVNNKGNIPIFGFEIKSSGSGSEDVRKTFDATLGLGEATTVNVASEVGGAESLTFIPIILGEKGVASEPFTCPESTGESVAV